MTEPNTSKPKDNLLNIDSQDVKSNTLDEQIDEIMLENLGDTGWNGSLLSKQYQAAKQQLKTLFTEHSKEVDRLARISELEKLPKSEIGKLANHSLAIDIHVQDRIAQLSKRNKGEDND